MILTEAIKAASAGAVSYPTEAFAKGGNSDEQNQERSY